jgi:hypothetical protein
MVQTHITYAVAISNAKIRYVAVISQALSLESQK